MQSFVRFEFKYAMPCTTARRLKSTLALHGMRADPNARETYDVTSLYFDSPRMEHYAEKVGGFLKRKKVRVRIYEPYLTDTTRSIWLEQKEKYDMRIHKKRIPLAHDQYNDLLVGSRAHLFNHFKTADAHTAQALFHSIVRHAMRPTIIVRYRRTPLVAFGWSDLRVTFDSDIEACQSSDLRYTRFMHPVAKGTTIMEVKFSRVLPAWFKAVIHACNLNRTTFSKYAEGVEAVYTYHPIPR